jgi:hypothetical protein
MTMSRPPHAPGHYDDAAAACASNSWLLSCAFATWIVRLPTTSGVGVLLDCNSDKGRPCTDVGNYSRIASHVAASVRWHVHRDGVCDYRAGKHYCAKGTIALLPFALSAFPEAHIFVKVDSDTVVHPERIVMLVAGLLRARPFAPSLHALDADASQQRLRAAWVRVYDNRSAPLTPQPDARLYLGSFAHTISLRHDGRARSSPDWLALEASLGVDVSSTVARALRCPFVGYAAGGPGYVLSRAAMVAMVQHGCVSKVRLHTVGIEPNRLDWPHAAALSPSLLRSLCVARSRWCAAAACRARASTAWITRTRPSGYALTCTVPRPTCADLDQTSAPPSSCGGRRVLILVWAIVLAGGTVPAAQATPVSSHKCATPFTFHVASKSAAAYLDEWRQMTRELDVTARRPPVPPSAFLLENALRPMLIGTRGAACPPVTRSGGNQSAATEREVSWRL